MCEVPAVEPTDEELVLTVLAGDREAYSTLVRRHQDAVYSVCRHFLGQAEEAQDAAQEAFVRGYCSLRRLKNRPAFGSWLRGIAAHVALDLARQRRRLLARPPESATEIGAAPEPDADPAAAAGARETLHQVQDAVRALPETYRAVAILRFGLEMKYIDIASALGISEGAVEVRLVRARRMLRKRLSPLLAGAPEGVM
jgi:RNA polymerase sigma factor (sigma-70 family)